MDVHTGAVLAMASNPTYDPSHLGGRHLDQELQPPAGQERQHAAARPRRSRRQRRSGRRSSRSTPWPPWRRASSRRRRPSSAPATTRTTARRGTAGCVSGHGSVNVTTALDESCDVYFYNVGYKFYQRPGTELRGLGRAPRPRQADGHRPARRGRRPRAHAGSGGSSTSPTPSTSSGSRATRSTWRSARATSRRRRCRWRSPTRRSPTAATS